MARWIRLRKPHFVVGLGLAVAFGGFVFIAGVGRSADSAESKVLPGGEGDSGWQTVDLSSGEHITFPELPATRYERASSGEGPLVMRVEGSASFLLYPLKARREFSSLRFEWRCEGKFEVEHAAEQVRREGDDARLRIGLVLAPQSGDAPRATSGLVSRRPAWLVRMERALVEAPAGLLYLIAGGPHRAGERWPSPYAEWIENLAVESQATGDDWFQVEHRFETPRAVLAIWVMADGDNSGSVFVTQLRNLAWLEE